MGSTAYITERLRLHNAGRVKSTKSNRPWILAETRSCATRAEAVILERLLKTGQQKEQLRRTYCH
ncbi:GIY-YIG nuclease family protein [Candidatus Saccharibacteria bacterium]|nr:GIY-YIG nuclease family protein [Candidatus Saccharibacteria bacterium]